MQTGSDSTDQSVSDFEVGFFPKNPAPVLPFVKKTDNVDGRLFVIDQEKENVVSDFLKADAPGSENRIGNIRICLRGNRKRADSYFITKLYINSVI